MFKVDRSSQKILRHTTVDLDIEVASVINLSEASGWVAAGLFIVKSPADL